MKRLTFLAYVFIYTITFSQTVTEWSPIKCPIKTRWTDKVTPSNALPEYPRPQMVRKSWESLNGLWDFSVTDSATESCPNIFDGKILVPYPLESSLSGVKRTLLPNQKIWYHRYINLNKITRNQRYLLHFGAADFEAKVYLNGKVQGTHKGGYQEFTFDITSDLHLGRNDLNVMILDPTDKGDNPKGKQVLKPGGIMYTATSGLWQTVWLEQVPNQYISSLYFTPNLDEEVLSLSVNEYQKTNDLRVQAIASNGSFVEGAPNTLLQLKIPNPHPWSPDDPFLYGLTIRLLRKGKIVDEVKSYFGMRSVKIRKDALGQERISLNNRSVFNLGVLDQGYWPDGLYTAPSDEALKWDIETIKNMGFNTIRKHIKIEPARWYYYCDKLGILVWQDMPYPANLGVEGKAEFEKENDENIKQLHNYPSIICWVLFNEGWNKYDQERLTSWIKRLDPSRIIDGHTGENYDQTSPEDITLKWINSDLTDIHDYPGPGIPPYLPGKARVLGEWGGVRVPTEGHEWDPSKGWGYIQVGKDEFSNKYEFMIKHLKLFEDEGLSAAIYTQPYDVEIEQNGLITYDREVFKISVDTIKKINSIIFQK